MTHGMRGSLELGAKPSGKPFRARKGRASALAACGFALGVLAGTAQVLAAEMPQARPTPADLAILGDAQVQHLSPAEMDAVRGGFFVPCVSAEICGGRGLNALPGNWNWVSSLFGQIRTNYPQVWYPLYPLSYGWLR